MLVLTGILGLAIALAAMDGCDDRGRNFHALFLMQLESTRLLTGDLFNLFVYFEVMLIASYGLMVHGGGGLRLRAGIQFVVINLCGSMVFLIALGLIYGGCGALNMVEVGEKLASARSKPLLDQLRGGLADTGLRAQARWCRFTSGCPRPTPTRRRWWPLFAVATKVGIYCIIRIQSVMLAGTQPCPIDYPVAAASRLLTVVIGMVGVLASRTLGQMASYSTLASSGTIMACLSLFDAQSLSGGMYYRSIRPWRARHYSWWSRPSRYDEAPWLTGCS